MKKLQNKTAICISIIFLMLISINAQNEVDAFRFSESDWEGTARFMGAGKAFGAVGAEFSALNTNPASIGLYKKSEITFTPLTLSISTNSSSYNANTTWAPGVKYNLGSAGIVLALPGISSSLWKKIQFGFGFNRIKNYNNIFSVEGRNFGKTIGSDFALSAEGLDCNNVNSWPLGITGDEAFMGWNSFLINPKEGSQTSYEPALRGVDMFHSSTVVQAGGKDELVFSSGTNYNDKLFLGATIGVPIINFTENRTFIEENDLESNTHNFQRLQIDEKLNVRAAGINFKLGVIYQPFDFFRFGAAFHTPTYYGTVKDYYEREMEANYWIEEDKKKKYYTLTLDPLANRSHYALSTPLRTMANFAFFIKQKAFISAEYEFVNYGSALMYSVDYNYNRENNIIKETFGFCHIARIGAEINLNQVFALRAGYNYSSTPYKDNINDGSKHYASLGFGFRTKFFYGDFAYALTTTKLKYWMFNPAFVNAVNNHFITHKLIFSLGLRF